MIKFLLQCIFSESGTTLAITRKTSGTIITAAGFNTNYDEIEAVVNSIDATNLAANSVTAPKLGTSLTRTNYGLAQHSDNTFYIDLHATPGLEFSGGKLRVDAYGLINLSANGTEWGRSGDVLFSSSPTTPDGFTDISSTYANKFLRISTTALSSGGADTHTHGAGSYTVPAHSHGGATGGVSFGGGGSLTSGALDTAHTHTISTEAAATITGTSASGDNVPAYMTLKAYQKS